MTQRESPGQQQHKNIPASTKYRTAVTVIIQSFRSNSSQFHSIDQIPYCSATNNSISPIFDHQDLIFFLCSVQMK